MNEKFVKLRYVECDAYCADCDWRSYAKNAHAMAAKHSYKTGHTVHIEVRSSHTIALRDGDYHKSWKSKKTAFEK